MLGIASSPLVFLNTFPASKPHKQVVFSANPGRLEFREVTGLNLNSFVYDLKTSLSISVPTFFVVSGLTILFELSKE